jgi:aldehyde dehydrogenase (NAD+)
MEGRLLVPILRMSHESRFSMGFLQAFLRAFFELSSNFSSKPVLLINTYPTRSDESIITSVHAASANDVDTAVQAARKALRNPSWRGISPSERGRMLFKLSQLVEDNSETLATIETWDNGKPYSVALNDDMYEVAEVFRYYGGYADKIHGQVIDTTPAKFAYTVREPVGVCGQIIP